MAGRAMTALLLCGVLVALAGWGAATWAVMRHHAPTSRFRQVATASLLLGSTLAVDVVRSLSPGIGATALIAMHVAAMGGCLGLIWRRSEARLELVLDAAAVALGIAMLIQIGMPSTGTVTDAPLGSVDVVGYTVALWQAQVLLQLDGDSVRPRLRGLRVLLGAIAGLRVAGWVCFGAESGAAVHSAGTIAVVLVALAHLGGGGLLLALGRTGPIRLTFHRGDQHHVPASYLVTGIALVVATAGALLFPQLLGPTVLTIGCGGASALVLRQMLTHARLRQEMAESLARERYLASLLADSGDIIMIANRSGVLSYVGPSAERVLGPGVAVAGRQVWTAMALPRRAFSAALTRLDAGSGTELLEGRREHIVLEAAMSLRGAEVLVSVRDVTERDRLRQRLHYLAYHDPLTGLVNRSRVLSRISAMLGRSELCAVLFIDLDRFKQVNDNSGHAVGDQVLQEVSRRLAELVRSGDLIGRLGGDEFVAVLSVGPEEAQGVATRIGEAISRPFEVGGREYQLGVSIGIAIGISGLLAEDLLRRADLAMYAAKRHRGSWVVYEAGLGRAALAQANIDVAVSKALRDKDMDVFLQPLVDLGSGRVVTVEALLRWRNDAGEISSPAEMLDFARRSGRMSEVTSWVLERSAEILARSPSNVAVAVNMPPEMLLARGISRHLTTLLAVHGVSAARLEIEVTEDQLLEQAARSSTILQRLRDLGMPVMIDDFGTGFSSLGYLLDLPIDGLKIDQRFTKVLPHSASARSIVGGLVGIAARLNLRVVAEGVESAEQHEWARRLGVHVGQGYWYARPESAAGLGDLTDLRSWSSSSAGAAWAPSAMV